jgi:hypothetical protein
VWSTLFPDDYLVNPLGMKSKQVDMVFRRMMQDRNNNELLSRFCKAADRASEAKRVMEGALHEEHQVFAEAMQRYYPRMCRRVLRAALRTAAPAG